MIIWLYNLVDALFWLATAAIFLRVLFSWVRADPYNPFVSLIYRVTEPILAPLRRYIPPIGGLDVTPLIALIILELLRRFVWMLLAAVF